MVYDKQILEALLTQNELLARQLRVQEETRDTLSVLVALGERVSDGGNAVAVLELR